jgi:hypothetical protein
MAGVPATGCAGQAPGPGPQTAEGGSAIDMVKATLLKRDEALQKAREALTTAQTAAAEKETTLASMQAQLQQDHATLEGRGIGRTKLRKRPRRPSGWGLTWQIRPPRLPRWGSSSGRSRARASRRSPGSSRSSPP